MFQKIGRTIATLVIGLASFSASATVEVFTVEDVITDFSVFSAGAPGYIGAGQTLNYTHLLFDNGFGPAGQLEALGGALTLSFFDDVCQPGFDTLCAQGGPAPTNEVKVQIGSELPGMETFDANTIFVGGIGIQATAMINATGVLNVGITSLMGDFYIGESTAAIRAIEKNGVSVPEPGVLALLAIGLIGLGAARPKQRY